MKLLFEKFRHFLGGKISVLVIVWFKFSPMVEYILFVIPTSFYSEFFGNFFANLKGQKPARIIGSSINKIKGLVISSWLHIAVA